MKKTVLLGLTALLLMPLGVSAQITADENTTSLQISKDVAVIDVSTFDVCENLKEIVVDAENEYFTSVDGVLFSKDKTELLYYPQDKDKTSYIIPDEVKVIGEGAFKENNNLEVVTLTYGITEIKASAFESCEAMTDTVLVNTVDTIGESAFKDCTRLTNIRIPKKVTKVEDKTFSGCSLLQLVTFGNSVTEIGVGAFSDCSALEYIYLPNELRKISDNTFLNCTMLKDITIPETVTEIGNDVFLGCDNLIHVFYQGTEEAWNNIDNNSEISNILYNSDGMFAVTECPGDGANVSVGENGTTEIKIAGVVSPVKKAFLSGTYMTDDNGVTIYSQTPLENAKLILQKREDGWGSRAKSYKTFDITTVDGIARVDVSEYLSEEFTVGEITMFLWENGTMRPLATPISFPNYGTGALSTKLRIDVYKKSETPVVEEVYLYEKYASSRIQLDENNEFSKVYSLTPGEYWIDVKGRTSAEIYRIDLTITE